MRNHNTTGNAGRRVMIFIDGSNLYHVLKQNADKLDLDYKKFSEKLCGDRELIRTYYYNIRQDSPENPKLAESQDRFLNALYETDYLEVKLGIWKQRGQTMVEKGVDVMIAADLISHAYEDHYDTAILVSGDADFYPAIQVVKDTGKQVEVAAFDSNLSSEAARVSDVLIKFDKGYFNDVWMSAGQKSNNMRTAAMRRRVTDEAASPNGEDKSPARSPAQAKRPFTHRYPDRRHAYGASRTNRAKSNGHSAGDSENSVRRTANRRRIVGIGQGSAKPQARTDRRALAVASRPRPVPPDQRKESTAAKGTASSQSQSRAGRRESWIAKMFSSRK